MASREGQLELRALFDKLDKDKDGRVSKNEWGQALTTNEDELAKYFGGSSLKGIGASFKRIDARSAVQVERLCEQTEFVRQRLPQFPLVIQLRYSYQ